MNLRTTIKTDPSVHKIGYSTAVMFTGSCFANEMGAMFKRGSMKVLVNPFGVLYNPLSVAESIEMIIINKKFKADDLYCHNDKYLSFFHDTSFSSFDPENSLELINDSVSRSHKFLSAAEFLFITFGTAWIYRWKANGMLVANCHKIPSSRFNREILQIDDITERYKDLLSRLKSFNNNLKVVFTVSPVRHLKDGAHENQISKSVLMLAINKLLEEDTDLSYFHSYEIVLDDLRDYRFYKKDMLHPNDTAIDYIWEIFRDKYFNPVDSDLYERIKNITDARDHIISVKHPEEIRKFRSSILTKIKGILKEYPDLDLSDLQEYFRNLS